MPSFPDGLKGKTVTIDSQTSLQDLINQVDKLPVGRYFSLDEESAFPSITVIGAEFHEERKGKTLMPSYGLASRYSSGGQKIDIPKKIERKFYVGAISVTSECNPHAKKTLQEAVDESTKLAQETEQDQIVVQIVRVVRLQKRPVSVQKV